MWLVYLYEQCSNWNGDLWKIAGAAFIARKMTAICCSGNCERIGFNVLWFLTSDVNWNFEKRRKIFRTVAAAPALKFYILSQATTRFSILPFLIPVCRFKGVLFFWWPIVNTFQHCRASQPSEGRSWATQERTFWGMAPLFRNVLSRKTCSGWNIFAGSQKHFQYILL